MRIKARLGVSVTLGSLLALIVTSVALGTHPRPGSGTPIHVPLVPAYNQCTAPDSTHVAPLSLLSCSNAVLSSDIVTMGMGEGGSGSLELKVFCTVGGSPPCDPSDGVNEEDIRAVFFQSDLRCAKVTSGCPAAPGDYTGRLIFQSTMRITDHANGTGGGGAVCPHPNGGGDPPCVTSTVQDFSFSVPTPSGASCVPVDPPTSGTGSTCSYTTTFNTVVPFFSGAVKEFQREVLATFGFQVLDAGEDGSVGGGCPPVCGTGDETTVAHQGLFLP